MTLRIEDMEPSDRVSLIGVNVHVGVFETGGSEVRASQAGTVSSIAEDEDKIMVLFKGVDLPLMWDKDQFASEVTTASANIT